MRRTCSIAVGADLALPLDYRQVCPLGFLAIEWLAVRLLGFSEFALRCFPMLCGLASVPLFYRLAREILGRGTPATFLAVGVFVVSEPLVRYSGEAKPYETDFLVSLVLLCLSVSWLRTPEKTKGLWLLAVAVPVAVAISLPSMFTIGAIVFVALLRIGSEAVPFRPCAVAGLVLAVGLSVAAMAFAGQYRTRPEDRAYFLKFWAAAFPPALSDPVALARWLGACTPGRFSHFLTVATPVWPGSTRWFSAASRWGALLFVGKGKRIVALLVLPMLLTLAAAALRRYPYGMSGRVNLYLVPSVLILTAAGASWIFSRAASRESRAEDHPGGWKLAGALRGVPLGDRPRPSLPSTLGSHRRRVRSLVLGRDVIGLRGRLRSAATWESRARRVLGRTHGSPTSTCVTSEFTPGVIVRGASALEPNLGATAATVRAGFQVARAGAGLPEMDRGASKPVHAQGGA